MSDQSFDSFQRLAIWEAHNSNCIYCHKPVEFDDFKVDHVIPEKISAPDLEAMKRGMGCDSILTC